MQKKEEKWGKRTDGTKKKKNPNMMIDINLTISLVTVNVNCPNNPPKSGNCQTGL